MTTLQTTERPNVLHTYSLVDLNEEVTMWGCPSAHITALEAAVSLHFHLAEQGVLDHYRPFWEADVRVRHVTGEFEPVEEGRWFEDPDGEEWTFIHGPDFT